MDRVSTAEFIRNFGSHSDKALSTPIVITKSDREGLVLLSLEHYERLRQAHEALSQQAKPSRSR